MSRPRREVGRAGFVVAVIVNALLLVVVSAHDTWRPWARGVITEDFVQVLWAVNLGLWTQLIGNAVLAVVHPQWLRRVTDFAFALVAVIGAVAFYRVFPVDFSRIGQAWLDGLTRVVLLVGILGGSLGALVALARISVGGGGHRPAAPQS